MDLTGQWPSCDWCKKAVKKVASVAAPAINSTVNAPFTWGAWGLAKATGARCTRRDGANICYGGATGWLLPKTESNGCPNSRDSSWHPPGKLSRAGQTHWTRKRVPANKHCEQKSVSSPAYPRSSRKRTTPRTVRQNEAMPDASCFLDMATCKAHQGRAQKRVSFEWNGSSSS